MSSYTVAAIEGQKSRLDQEAFDRDSQAQNAKEAKKAAAKNLDAAAKKAARDKEKMLKDREMSGLKMLQRRIMLRFKAFPWLLDNVPEPSKNAGAEEMREIEDSQKLELNLQGADKRVNGYVQQFFMGLQTTWGDGKGMTMLPENMRFDFRNASTVICHPIVKDQLDPLVKETIIEYPWLVEMPLPMRWAEAIFQALVMIHQFNTNPEFRAMLSAQAIPEDVLKKMAAQAGVPARKVDKGKERVDEDVGEPAQLPF